MEQTDWIQSESQVAVIELTHSLSVSWIFLHPTAVQPHQTREVHGLVDSSHGLVNDFNRELARIVFPLHI